MLRNKMAQFRKFRPALAAFLLMMSMALTTTGLSFFVGPVCAELNLGRGAFTVYYSLMTAAGTLSAPILGQIIQRRGVSAVAAVSALWTAAGLWCFSWCSELWMFYLTGAMTGVFGTACVTLCAGVIVQTAYRGEEASRLTGIVMAGSGLGGMIVSMALPGLIEGFGWQMGYRLTAAAWLMLVLCAALLLRGTEEAGERASSGVGSMTGAIRSGRMALLILMMFLLSAASGVQQQLPGILSGAGFSPEGIGGAMSFFTAALALGKILQGMLYGKAGVRRGGSAMVLLYILGFLLLGASQAWTGLLTLAVGMGTVTTLMPIVTRQVFGSEAYAGIWGILSAVSNLGALTAAPLFGLAYDLTGSYAGAMTAVAVLLTPALVTLAVVLRTEK